MSGDWRAVAACPACGGAGLPIGPLFGRDHSFGTAQAPPPPEPVTLVRCTACTLVFKTMVPTPALLVALTETVQGSLWRSDYDYADERALIARTAAASACDVLDIGAADGLFLKTLAGDGRRSALDIVRFDALAIRGEFIRGLLDVPVPAWSGAPYDVVTAFDVLEHLYDPPTAFANLRRFVAADGIVVVETGDSDAVPASALPRWNYLNLFEHHVAWNRASIERIAATSGFEVVSFERKAHKGERPPALRTRLKHRAFAIAPQLYRAGYAAVGRPFAVPGDPTARDHLRVVLRPVPGGQAKSSHRRHGDADMAGASL